MPVSQRQNFLKERKAQIGFGFIFLGAIIGIFCFAYNRSTDSPASSKTSNNNNSVNRDIGNFQPPIPVTPESKCLLEDSKDLDLSGITPKGLIEALKKLESSKLPDEDINAIRKNHQESMAKLAAKPETSKKPVKQSEGSDTIDNSLNHSDTKERLAGETKEVEGKKEESDSNSNGPKLENGSNKAEHPKVEESSPKEQGPLISLNPQVQWSGGNAEFAEKMKSISIKIENNERAMAFQEYVENICKVIL